MAGMQDCLNKILRFNSGVLRYFRTRSNSNFTPIADLFLIILKSVGTIKPITFIFR